MTCSENKQAGRVCLVGAGPGDDGLITVRGLEMLRRADVVIYDALANARLLRHVPAGATIIALGQRGESDKLNQDQINQTMLDATRRGKFVVRLKGGDPYVFGRGGEEAAFLGRHGIACEVVPGVTAGVAAPMAAGIPITRRDLGSSITFLTGHEDPGKNESAVDYAALAALIKSGGNACIYMGFARCDSIAAQLQQSGLAGDTPATVVQWGFTPRQRSIRSTLANLTNDVAKQRLGPPAIIVVGRAAAVDERGLDFYTARPLFGKTIVITRTRHQASQFYQMLTELGANVIEAPTIKLIEPNDFTMIDAAIRDLRSFNWLVLTSVNGVAALRRRLDLLDLDSRHLAPVRVAVIGDATEQAVQDELCVRADLVPPHYVAESLAEALIQQYDVSGKRFLLLRADIARSALRDRLEDAGAEVTDLHIYESKRVDTLPEDALTALRQGDVDWVTFTSSSTAVNMAELLGSEKELLTQVNLASIGPITSQTLRELDLPVTVEADPSNLDGLVAAIVNAPIQNLVSG